MFTGQSSVKYHGIKVILPLGILAAGIFYWLDAVLQMTLTVSVTDALVSVILLYILFLCINYIPAIKFSRGLDAVHFALYSLIFAFLWAYAGKYILIHIFSSDDKYLLVWKNNFFIRGFLGWIVIYGYSIIEYLKSSLIQLQNEVHEEEQARQLMKDAELFKLRQQLQPHFLFNSLNSINALIVREPQRARQMIQQLSDYLRNTIKKEDDNFIDFKEEMNDLRLYLAIEQVRFGHRLIIKEDVDMDCEEIKVPPFLLQPLVENAIKYGLYGTTGIVTIYISIKKKTNELIFTIRNPYDADAVATKGTGFGLESIKRRLYLLFARNDLLRIENGIAPGKNAEGENLYTFTATIIIPLNNAK